MKGSEVFAEIVSMIGGTMAQDRGGSPVQDKGLNPTIPEAKPQGKLPSLKMPKGVGWPTGRTPVAAPGLKVNAFAQSLKHPRFLYVLPNGDVVAAESLTQAGKPRTLFDHAITTT